MKKIIITENQAILLKNYINEVNNADKSKVINEYFKQIKIEFGETIKNAKIGDTIMLTFGVEKDDDSGEIDDTTMTAITFLVVRVGGGSISVKHINSKGKDLRLNTQDKNKEYSIFPKMSLSFNKGYPYFILKVKEENNKFINHNIENFQTISLYDENLDAETAESYSENPESMKNKIDIDSRIVDSANKYSEMRRKLIGKIIYDPSRLRMNNFFFYPKGLIELDKIAEKYGVYDRDNGNNTRIKFKLLSGNVPENDVKGPNNEKILEMIGGNEYVGVLDEEEKEIKVRNKSTEFIIKFDENSIITTGTKFNVSISVMVSGEEVVKEQATIRVIKI